MRLRVGGQSVRAVPEAPGGGDLGAGAGAGFADGWMASEIFAEWVAAMRSSVSGAERMPAWVRNEMKSVETEIKYAGYLEKQRRSIEKMKKAEDRTDSGVVRLPECERAVARDAADV